MASRLDKLRDELDNARTQAAIDPVTKIYNRAAFDEQVEREIDLSNLFGTRSCLIMVDLDHFEWVNDTYGHPCGDEVLRQVADALTRCFMRRGDFVTRYGGEEFAIVLRDMPVPAARDVAERGMTTVRNLEILHGDLAEPIRVTASMGIAQLRQGETSSSWIERADRALYQAKDGGRDPIEGDPIDLDEASVELGLKTPELVRPDPNPRGTLPEFSWEFARIRGSNLATGVAPPYSPALQRSLPGAKTRTWPRSPRSTATTSATR